MIHEKVQDSKKIQPNIDKEKLTSLLQTIHNKIDEYDCVVEQTPCADVFRKRIGVDIGLLTRQLTQTMGYDPNEAQAYAVLDEERNINRTYLNILFQASAYALEK